MDIQELMNRRIAVLLSGGVDSSVVVYEFARLGLHPDCFYIRIGPEEKEEWDCNSEEDMEMATAVARRFGCRLQVVDCHKEYWNQVTRYTMEKVKAGFTPNPDVMCNRLIKFGAFDEKMGHDYDLIATGHYAQTEWIDGRKWLTTSPDPVKDQTDFLAQIYDWQLKKALFPIGHYEKDEVRRIAEREHLINAHRKDSQGICFLGNIDYNEYVRRYLGEQTGDIIELETGKKIGEHRGLWFHTLVRRTERRRQEHPLCKPWLRSRDGLQEQLPAARLPFPYRRHHGTAGEDYLQDPPHTGVPSGKGRTAAGRKVHHSFSRAHPRSSPRTILRRL